MTNKMQVVSIETPELGQLDQSKAAKIRATFEPMAEMLSEFESRYKALMATPIEQMTPELCADYKRFRLDVAKVRIATGKAKDKAKELLKLEDRAIMGVHNILVYSVKDMEDGAKEREDYFENLEFQRIESLRSERWAGLSQYMEVEPQGLGQMDDDTYAMLFNGAKAAHDAKVEAERKAEEERIAKEKAEAEERERQRQENIRLKAEAEAREKEIAEERRKQAEKEEAERKERERIQAEADAKLKAERDAREKAEAEIKARRAAEEKARKQAEADAKKAAKAPVKTRMKNAVNSLEMPILEGLSDSDAAFYAEIVAKHSGFKKWAIEVIEQL